MKTVAEIEEVLAAALGQRVSAELIPQGVNNQVYKIRTTEGAKRQLILRVPAMGKQITSYGAIGSRQIRDRYALFAASGYCPKVLEVDLPGDALLCEFVPGRMAEFPDDLPAVTRALAALHSCELVRERRRGDAADRPDREGGTPDKTGTPRQDDEVNQADVPGQRSSASAMNKGGAPGQLVDYATMMQVVEQRMQHFDAVASYISMDEEARRIVQDLVGQCLNAPVDEIFAYEQDPNTLLVPMLKDANPGNFIISTEYPPRDDAAAPPEGADKSAEQGGSVGAAERDAEQVNAGQGGIEQAKAGQGVRGEQDEEGGAKAGDGSAARAVVVDVEGGFYGLPIIDVGHSSLYSAVLWQDDSAQPLAAAKILQLYEEYFAHFARINGPELARAARPPAQVLCSFRIATLCRCLAWMINLIYLVSKGQTQVLPKKLARAKLILSRAKLQQALHTEQQIKQLLGK